MKDIKKFWIGGAFFFVYGVGYMLARQSGYIVHSVVRDHSYHYLEHSVIAGDGKFIGGVVKNVVAGSYTPLRLIEVKYWYWKQPIGTLLTAQHRKKLLP